MQQGEAVGSGLLLPLASIIPAIVRGGNSTFACGARPGGWGNAGSWLDFRCLRSALDMIQSGLKKVSPAAGQTR